MLAENPQLVAAVNATFAAKTNPATDFSSLWPYLQAVKNNHRYQDILLLDSDDEIKFSLSGRQGAR